MKRSAEYVERMRCRVNAGYRSTQVVRFQARVNVMGEADCWEWAGVRTMAGYGRMKWDGKPTYAHRLAYGLANGAMPPADLFVRHKCDNPPCCNPSHLLLGTHADNMHDASERKRGVGHPSAIPFSDVPNIRAYLSAGQPIVSTADIFGYNASAVRAVKYGIGYPMDIR